jgi:methyl-accepting chemotaxis protein
MFNNFTIKSRFGVILSTLIIGFTLFGLATLNAMQTLNVNGAIYQRIVQSKDLIADILPPPEYILESYLVVLQTLNAENEAEVETLKKRFDVLKGEYDTRHQYWIDQQLEPELNVPLLDKSYQAADIFYKEALETFFPAIQAANKEVAFASLKKMRQVYEIHRSGIDEVVRLTTDRYTLDEKNAQTSIHHYQIGLACIFLFSIGLAIFFTLLISRGILDELGGEPHYAATVVKQIANGDLSVKVALEPNDKNSLLYSINTMRETLAKIIANTNSVMSDISRGELSSQITVEVQGDFVQLRDSINRTVIQLRVTLFALNDVMNSIYNADFSEVVVAHVQGNFKDTIEKAVISQTAIRTMLDDIVVIMEFVAMGDLNHRVTAEGRGNFLLLKDNINKTLSALECLNEIDHVIGAVARGDLTQMITTQYPGIFGKVTTNINHTTTNLKTLIREIQNTSEMIANAVKEIAAGNNDLSQRTEEQASSLQQTAASMEELSATVQQNVANAKHANGLALGSSTTAKKGVSVVDDVVLTMENINKSSQQIVDIIMVIDDIAFQTNILALNAAVEAARAGEQGKGFAVVATEVRSLAQRAANAAGEIKRLIGDSVERISNGAKQVEQAGTTMEEIVNSIQKVTTMMSEITTASIEQNAGIDQVHQAVTQMDDVTQQNAALVEQAAAATGLLNEQTRSLATEMAHFKTS